jgi:hypothetical protein
MKLNTLTLDNMIIHRIPRKSDDGGDPVFSDVADPQADDVRGFFRQRLSGVMASKGLLIERDPQGDPTTADAVDAILADAKTLVAQSRIIGQRLHDVQDKRSPEGILLVATGKIDGLPCVGLLKLEHERGVRAEEEQVKGGRRFRVVLHRDLLLTQKTVVFKGAVFRMKSAKSTTLTGMGSDLQVVGHMAAFFLTRFLGCRLLDEPGVSTERYFDAAEQWIASVPDAERKARYEIALLAQMHADTKTIDPDKFARETLTVDEHQPFIAHLGGQGVAATPFPKDTSQIDTRIKRLAYVFNSGLRLIGPPEAVEEHVTVKERSSGTRVTIDDGIADIRTRS